MKLIKIFGLILAVIVIIVTAIIAYISLAFPNTGPAADIHIERTPERLRRGEYLANHVTICLNCHSERNWSLYAGPTIAGTGGEGGEKFGREMGFPGDFYSPNITPAGLSGWTDGEIVRAVTTGMSKDGRALFPVMGFHRYGLMDKEDIYSIVAYIRTLPAIVHPVPPSRPDFPMNVLLKLMPHPANFGNLPPVSNPVAYGRYLVNAAGCEDCHSRPDRAKLLAGSEFGGGREFRMANGIATSTNITPEKETGIGTWSKAAFLQRFKAYADSSYQPQKIGPRDHNTPMPWTRYAGMTTEDLAAMYDLLQTVKPIRNEVKKFKPLQ